MAKRIYFIVKVYRKGRGSGIYPVETYEKDDYADASILFNAMKELDPYRNKRIELNRYVTEDGNLIDYDTMQEFNN